MPKATILSAMVLGLLLPCVALTSSAAGNPSALSAAGQREQPDQKDAKLKELLKERLATLRALVKLVAAEYQSGKVSFDRAHQATMAMFHAKLELCESDKERIAVLEEAVSAGGRHHQRG
jgi:hypothetical protein